jgi:hypothetical protein
MLKPALPAIALLALTTLPAYAGVPLKEDLKDCKLPHGQVFIPYAGTDEAAMAGAGDLLKFSDGTLTPLPPTDLAKKVALADTVRAKNLGDLQLFQDEKGTFWAVSGRIVDAGTHYLADLAAMKLSRPVMIPGNAKRPAGCLPEIQEGRAFLIETTDSHYAIFRVLDVTKAGATLQYVYQPSGEIAFELKEAPLIETHAKTPARPEPAADSADATPAPAVTETRRAPTPEGGIVLRIGDTKAPTGTILEPYLSTHLKQRDLLIQSRLKTLRAPAKTQAEIDKKVQAINELVTLRAEEAADALVEQVSFVNPRDLGKDFEDSVHPCFAALKKLGKPATNAALKALRQMDLNGPTEGLENPSYRAGLLGLVIRAVEGDTVGEFILKNERDATHDPARRAMFEQLLSPGK